MDLSRKKLLNCILYRVLPVTSSRSFYLAEKFQPKPKKRVLSYEDIKVHPADRINRPNELENVSKSGVPLNIGFNVKPKKFEMPKRTEQQVAWFEEKSRLGTLTVNTQEAFKEFVDLESHTQIKSLIHDYGVFDDLFQGADFNNVFPLETKFIDDIRVFYGNILTPTQTSEKPRVRLDCSGTEPKEFFWTLIMACPDGSLVDDEAENIHWAVSNIKSNQSSKDGEELVPYLPPIPYRGTGFHRYVMLAFHHKERVHFDGDFFKFKSDCPLERRTFSTLKFCQKFEEVMTPMSLSFFQAQWDGSVTETFHSTLRLREPGFEWDSPPAYVAPYEKFPRNADISYFEQYHPDLYTRHDKDTYIDKKWDQIWNTEEYSKHIALHEDEIDPERRAIVWRQDYSEQFLTEEEAYRNEITKLLKEYKYFEDRPKKKPKFGYLV